MSNVGPDTFSIIPNQILNFPRRWFGVNVEKSSVPEIILGQKEDTMSEVNLIVNAVTALVICSTAVGIGSGPLGAVQFLVCFATALTALLLGLQFVAWPRFNNLPPDPQHRAH